MSETWAKKYSVNILVIDDFPGNINRLCLISHDYSLLMRDLLVFAIDPPSANYCGTTTARII